MDSASLLWGNFMYWQSDDQDLVTTANRNSGTQQTQVETVFTFTQWDWLPLEILEGDCFSTSILQGLGELHFTLIFIEIFKIRDSERCLYQNQNQVKNGHWNQDGSSIKFPHKFWKISSQCLLSQVPLSSLLDYFWAEKIFPENRHAAPQRFLTQKLARHCVSVRTFF